VAEQVVQAAEEEVRRLPSPPIPKEENSFCISLLPHEAIILYPGTIGIIFRGYLSIK
jgi:hypothetical protein